MYSTDIENVAHYAEKKSAALKKSSSKYITAAALAGMYIGIAIIFIYTIGAYLNADHSPATKIVMGASFGVGLSLVMVAGSELFTGTNMVMTIGALEKKVTWLDAIKIWAASFFGNFIGSLIVAGVYALTGLTHGKVGEFMVEMASAKMNATSLQLFSRAILCNILVCLAVWCFYKLKDDTAKLIMIFWCLFAFISSGYEHSVANMTLLSLALMLPHGAAVSLAGLAHNLLIVTIGNLAGGAVFLALPYWFISKEK